MKQITISVAHGSALAQAHQQAITWIGQRVQAQAKLPRLYGRVLGADADFAAAVPLALTLRKVKLGERCARTLIHQEKINKLADSFLKYNRLNCSHIPLPRHFYALNNLIHMAVALAGDTVNSTILRGDSNRHSVQSHLHAQPDNSSTLKLSPSS